LATVTSADRETVETLKKAIATLTDQLKAKDIWAKYHKAELKRLLVAQGNATPILPTVQSNAYMRKYFKPKMTTTVGHMGIRWEWIIQVETLPRMPWDTRMKLPRTISWEVILGAANSFDKMGTFR
jgi:hypothetical protein